MSRCSTDSSCSSIVMVMSCFSSVSGLELSVRTVFLAGPHSIFADYPELPACLMQRGDALVGHLYQLSRLDPGPVVRGNHIGLNHHGHAGAKGEIRGRRVGSAPGPEHGRQIAAAETMQQIIVGREACVLDDRCRLDHLLGRGAVAEHPADRVKGGRGHLVELAEERRGTHSYRVGPQYLARITPE